MDGALSGVLRLSALRPAPRHCALVGAVSPPVYRADGCCAPRPLFPRCPQGDRDNTPQPSDVCGPTLSEVLGFTLQAPLSG